MISRLVLLVALAFAQEILAQETELGVSFEWVIVGDPGNPGDPLTGLSDGTPPPPLRGAVPYVYRISKNETTIGQYAAFLNAVAKSDPHGLYHPDSAKQHTVSGISRIGTDGDYVYYVKNVHSFSGGWNSANLPVTYVDYLDAVRFVNWLHKGGLHGYSRRSIFLFDYGDNPWDWSRSMGHRDI